VMAYEDEQITERNGRKITNSVVREVRVHKVPTKRLGRFVHLNTCWNRSQSVLGVYDDH
jgi:hypothetical protein